MCGIIGGTNPTWDYTGALDKLYHRGPDGRRIVKLPEITLGFVRLAIMDLSDNGMQPMFTADGRCVIVFNGEIYGWQKERKLLEEKGYVFKSNSDTEVFLNGYKEYGNKIFDRLDGMFAVAIYDSEKQQIILCRDRFGIKPLYYYVCGSQLAFSSELKGITAMCNNVSFDVDKIAVYDYLLYQYIPDPKSMYKNIYKLEPSTMIVYDLRKKEYNTMINTGI